MSGYRDRPVVLVVDDNPVNLGVLFEYLGDHGFKVLVAEDGESAIEQAQYAQPDLILLDVMMPGIDGFETCRRLCADPSTTGIPIIVMTALTETSHKVESFRAGAVDYIAKPFQHEEVLARVANHLRLRELQKRLEDRNAEYQAEIAQRKQAEATLAEHVAELEARSAELEAFARTVAHDLKDPLSQIVGLSQILEEDEALGDEAREYLAHIQRTGYRMSDIIDALLLLARVRDARVVSEPVDMVAVLDSTRERLAHLIAERRAELSIAPALPAAIAHGPWLEEVWANYLSNALKYGGEPPRIEIGADPQPDRRIRYWVRDNGPGLSREQQGRLFTEFTRLHRGDQGGGHGLGLSIVRRIVEKLGGEVGVDSAPGHGSTFYFTLAAA